MTVAGRVDPEMGQARGVRVTNSRRADTIQLTEISRLLESKQLKPKVGKVFPLAEARRAHEQSETRHGQGRIVLRTS